ncbi:hypothetical protein [Pseudomarimonas salicorniae]|uniref:Ig-like domain (Group 3) n=1 Tax=Pseudomarimonas salicorniae TaxID=2933270 RepID=A0ABT0GJW0_9GAMM|nr:hypothetical protein [Lysobacter sp. CAU 1642]MCK7594300.1 hypothetical protein [Lysobacter sp. CAU 1642]
MSLPLSAAALSMSLLFTAAQVPPGESLEGTLELSTDPALRYGLDGAPPGPAGRIPAAPSAPGPHHLVVYGEDGLPARWLRFEVIGQPEAVPTLALSVDSAGPTLEVHVEGDVEREGRRYAGGGTRLRVEGADPSGLGGDLALLLDGAPLADPAQPSWPDGDRQITLLARGSDALGNLAESEPLHLQLDRSSPRLAAARAEPVEGVAADIVAPGERVRLQLEDTGVGLDSLELGGTTLALEGAPTASLTLEPGADDRYRLRDRLGNESRGSLPLRLDSEGPRLVLVSDGHAQAVTNKARLPRSERLELVAEDALAGVDRACVKLSIWYRDCRPLPITLVGIDPGRYRVVFRATDRLGHRARERYYIEVLP